jgi:ribosomal protein L28
MFAKIVYMRKCSICGKKSILVWKRRKLRGKFNPTSKKRAKPNLQWVKIPIGIKKEPYKKFAGKRILACTKCIKALARL